MMCVNVVLFGIFLNTIQHSSGERRITDGKPVKESKRYVAYLLKAPGSPQHYDAWLCGGTIVSPLYIITSAACIEDVQHMYAIAGYTKYVRSDEIDDDECTRNKKKKVVFTCVPRAYDLNYEKVEKWSHIDIGVVKVESPYDFTDTSYETLCTHIPNQLMINYQYKYQESGTDAVVFGWGHSEIWRKPSDTTDHNQPELRYAATQVTHKEECKKAYGQIPEMNEIIDKYMICTNRAGNIDDVGELIVTSRPVAEGCDENVMRQHKMPLKNLLPPVQMISLRRASINCHCVGKDALFAWDNAECEDKPPPPAVIASQEGNDSITTRRHGICQNDHGGPLVTWMGSHEVLIGVASVFRVTDESKCQGPYLFTSTQCNGAFLDCIINGEKSTRRNICDKSPKERGFDFIRQTISWRNHPDGPAENEIIRFRPLLPIRS